MLDEMALYRKNLEKLLHDNAACTDWKMELKFFKILFLHLQLERLIHLLVMLTVGLATLASCLFTMGNPIFVLFILDGILMILFFAYILHYRKLENTAQSWYALLNALMRKSPRKIA